MAQIQFDSSDTTPWAERYGNGADGSLTVSANSEINPAAATCTGTSGSTSLAATGSFVADDLILVIQKEDGGVGASYGNWHLNVVSSYVAGTITTKYPLPHEYVAGAIVVEMFRFTTVTVNAGFTLFGATTGTDQGVLAFFATTSVTVNGYLDVRSATAGGAGKGTGNDGDTGQGVLGSGTTQSARRVNAGGGGAGGNASGGGGANGANGTAGNNVGGTGGQGGTTVGNAALTLMCMGGAGGSGANQTGGGTSGSGGNGGGIIIVISPVINVSGGTLVNANGAIGGTMDVSNVDNDGGGGAGGSILLKGQIITLGTNILTATGGAGGSTGGGAAGDGRIHIDYGQTLTGTSQPTLDSSLDSILNDQGGFFFISS